ncbi:MAG: methyltransferase domain-containing protein [Lentisphaerae bacterium]|nr:methyltransferase domain-containing protein [Lentisphaerota bacterium]
MGAEGARDIRAEADGPELQVVRRGLRDLGYAARDPGGGRVSPEDLRRLGRWLLYRQRRDAAAAAQAGGSAEALVRAGLGARRLRRPEADRVLEALGRMGPGGGDGPRRCFPGGTRSLLVFSFDDFCASGKPVRRALRARQGRDACRALARYPFNAADDVRELCRLFARHNARGTAFVLPAWLGIKQALPLAGYAGVPRRLIVTLKDAGWDVGTHIKPRRLDDYNAARRAFERRFGFAPAGHRGHELGWTGWTDDWERLAELGYLYDSTWCWGGHEGMAWPTGSAAPTAATDAAGRALPLLEIPANLWLEDLVGLGPEGAAGLVRTALDRDPGLYHIAGHSWRVRDEPYGAVLDALLGLARSRGDTGEVVSLKELALFWNVRALPGRESPPGGTPAADGRAARQRAEAGNRDWACPVCGGCTAAGARPYPSSLPLLRDAELVTCARCGTGAARPMPDPSALRDANAAYWTGLQDDDAHARALYAAQAFYRLRYLRRELGGGLDRLRILDVGAGHGFVFDALRGAARDRYVAVEPDGRMQAALRARGVRHVVPTLETAACAGPFDLVVLSHVLEHMPDPRGALRRIARRVAPGGRIFIEVPNRDDRYKSDLGPHCFVFGARSLLYLCRTLGLTVVDLAICGRAAEAVEPEPGRGGRSRRALRTLLPGAVRLKRRLAPPWLRSRWGRARFNARYGFDRFGKDGPWLRCLAQR